MGWHLGNSCHACKSVLLSGPWPLCCVKKDCSRVVFDKYWIRLYFKEQKTPLSLHMYMCLHDVFILGRDLIWTTSGGSRPCSCRVSIIRYGKTAWKINPTPECIPLGIPLPSPTYTLSSFVKMRHVDIKINVKCLNMPLFIPKHPCATTRNTIFNSCLCLLPNRQWSFYVIELYLLFWRNHLR